MGLFDRWFGGSAEQMESPEPRARFSMDVPADLLEAMTQGGVIAPRVSRDVALQVPAVLRSRNLIAGTLASLPHTVHGPDRREVENQYLLGGNIDPDIPNSVLLAMTYEDLLFEGVAWWRVTSFGRLDYPASAAHVPVGSVHVAQSSSLPPSQMRISPDQAIPQVGQVFIDGLPVADREVIRFDSPNPPLLRHAARAIRTALALDTAASTYADDPLPLGVFTPKEGVEAGTREEIENMLDDWEAARRQRAWGYVGAALDLNALQWNPEQLQLADQRQHAVLEIARAAGIDPEDLGVSTTSRTYANSEQRRQDLLDFTLGAYVSAIQDRLSMRDILPRGYRAKVKFAGFLRSDTKTRMDTYEIGLRVGAYTEDEIRELEDKPKLTAAERAAARDRTPSVGHGEVPRPPADQPSEEPKMEPKMEREQPTFNGDHDSMQIMSFDDDEVYASFRVNRETRTISGLLVPWGKAAPSGAAKWRFDSGTLHWSSDSRIKLNRHHDRRQLVAYATRLTDTPAGLEGSFKVARGPDGDLALSLAEDKVLDGFSIEIDFEDGDEWERDPDDGVRNVRSATLRGVALTGTPAFDDARVESVAADRYMIGDPDGPEGRREDRHEAGRQRPGPRIRVRSRQLHIKAG